MDETKAPAAPANAKAAEARARAAAARAALAEAQAAETAAKLAEDEELCRRVVAALGVAGGDATASALAKALQAPKADVNRVLHRGEGRHFRKAGLRWSLVPAAEQPWAVVELVWAAAVLHLGPQSDEALAKLFKGLAPWCASAPCEVRVVSGPDSVARVAVECGFTVL